MPAIVETRDLTRRFGSMVALDQLNLEIPQGAIFGFIGPNGAGKTTTMRILTTLLPPSGGEAWVGGHSVLKDPTGVRKVVGFMPDFFGVYDNMKVWEYLDFFGRSYGVAASRRATMIGELLNLVDLGHKREEFVMTLSRGMKQRLSLARTMIHDPALLILDEPASGLDPRARIELRELLKELRALGKTVMISSHILTELAEMCTHIAIIERGHLLAAGDVQTILRSLQPHRTLELRVLEGADRAQALLRDYKGILDVRRDLTAAVPGKAEEAAGSDARVATNQQLEPHVEPNDSVNSVSNPLNPLTLLIDYTGDERGMGDLLSMLISNGVVVTRFAEQSSDLEDIFMQVTKGIVQ
ncbi:MAG TPA: ABC transporter ATP-binding protein [Roseiflexaceae bacterium]|nr:ABC transporter ATP-binding protein [Roseiflexaceae bacterium]